MSTRNAKPTIAFGSALESAFSAVPEEFRSKIIESYFELKSAFLNAQYEQCGLKAGWFCEAVLRYLQSKLTSSFVPFGQQITRFDLECGKLEQVPRTAAPESLRVIIPRGLSFLYTLRNKRGIGHIGGDVDANQIDAATASRVADWCMCELIRALHNMPLENAQNLLDTIAVRNVPHIWRVDGKSRVLKRMDYSSQVLLILHSDIDASVSVDHLIESTEHSNSSVFRRDILGKLHAARLINYDQNERSVRISPTGVREVEEILLKKLNGN
ncbi:MAG: hypothetical protein JWM83_1537 [Candidatus Angelobacter sp.]|nr:hypothetical protein [Candidatus Angelobacter sp.]